MMPSMSEPFDKALRSKMMTAQKKHLSGDSKQLPLGDLSKTEYRKCGLIATAKIRPEEPRAPKPKVESKKSKSTSKSKSDQKKGKKTSKPKPTETETAPVKVENVEQSHPPTKKAKKVKVPPEQIQDVLEGLQELKVSNIFEKFLFKNSI